MKLETMTIVQRIALAAGATALVGGAAQALPFDWTAGHGDIDAHVHDGELHLGYHFHLDEPGEEAILDGVPNTTQEEFEASDIVIVVNNNAFVPGQGYRVPATETPGLPYIGWATEGFAGEHGDHHDHDHDHDHEHEHETYEVDGDILFRLVGWTTPTGGEFFFGNEDLGTFTSFFSSTGSTPQDFTLEPGVHVHPELRFTELGTYTLDIQAFASVNLDPDAATEVFTPLSSDVETFTFNVVPTPGTGALFALAGLGATRRRRG